MKDDPILCYCFGVTRDEVISYLGQPDARLDDFIAKTGMTTKCTACCVDLDMLLDEIHSSEHLVRHRAGEVEALTHGLTEAVDRVDSGFFLCDDDVTTHIRLANFAPPGADTGMCTPHDYRLTLFDNDGHTTHRSSGHIGVEEEQTITLADTPNCPKEGWFLIHLKPTGAGRYGTLRPQVAFEGPSWAGCYHTQFHADASPEGRRSGAQLRTLKGRTRTTISIINGRGAPSHYLATLETRDGIRSVEGNLAGNGATLLDVDTTFGELPDNEGVVFRITSEKPTRKNLIYRHPDGTLGFDHFPNRV